MEMNSLKAAIQNGYDRMFGSGAFAAKFGKRDGGGPNGGFLPLVEAAGLALASQEQGVANDASMPPANAPTPTPGPAVSPKALFDKIESLEKDLAATHNMLKGVQANNLKLEAALSVANEKLANYDRKLADESAFEAAKLVARIGLQAPLKESRAFINSNNVMEEFSKITDPKARAAYYQAHKKELI